MSVRPLKPLKAHCENCAECLHDVALSCEKPHPPIRGSPSISDAEIQSPDCPANSWLGSWLLQLLPVMLLAAFAIIISSSLAGALGYIAPAMQIAALALASVCAMVWAVLRDAVSTRRAEQKRLTALDRIESLAHAEREALIAKERTDAAVAAKTTLVANMSHEIRTPMNGVIGFAQLILSTSLNGEQRKYAELILESGESMVVLLNDILDIAKIEAGKMTVAPEPTNVRDLVTSSTSMMKAAARQKDLQLTVSIDERVPRELMLDGLRVRQVLSNLIGNAIKFTDQGAVDVRLRPVPAPVVVAGEIIELSIADTGIGIAPEWQSVIFDQFVQADGSSRRTHGGTGLGLPISRKLVQLMDGTLTLESREGEGTLVALRIPLIRVPSARAATERPASKPGAAASAKRTLPPNR